MTALLEQKIEAVLETVQKPSRYIGGEANQVRKPQATRLVALCYPDAYEIGISNQALQILYTQVNDPSGTALFVDGRISHRWCGRASINGTIAVPKSAATVSNVALTANSLVLATIQSASPGVYVDSAVPHPTTGKITITLSAAVTKKVVVAWFVVDLMPIVV